MPRPFRAATRVHAPQRPIRRLLVAAGLVLSTVACASGHDVELAGPDDEVVNAAALEELAFTATSDDPAELAGATVELDGRDVTADADHGDGGLTYLPGDLDDGDHEVTLTLPAAGDGITETWSFTVAATPPELEVTEPADGVVVGADELTVGGHTTGEEVQVEGAEVEVDGDGSFRFALTDPPDGEVELTAVDEHGNVTTTGTALVVIPSRVDVEHVRAVHVTPHAWADDGLRERILAMAEDGRVTSVQLDLKDESGTIGYDSEIPLAHEAGAVTGTYDLADAVEQLHARGVHVVGRIVAFRDQVLAEHAWDNGDEDMVIQTPDGQPYAGYGGFTSFAHPDVWAYNLDVAEEAAAAGVDDILWDYIRRPDGAAENLVVDGLSDDADAGTMEDAIVAFTAEADERLARYGVGHGASVYGIAATRPTEIAQDIPAMAEHLDYVAPMVYPSHWGDGEYGVEDPNRQPYDITYRSLADFQTAVEGTGARVVPWLEDTDYRAWDRAEQVREQIRAAADLGLDEWVMWDPSVDYTVEAYPQR